MLDTWSKFVYRHAKTILICGLIIVLTAGVFGSSVFSHLETDGDDFANPGSGSLNYENMSLKDFSNVQGQLIILFSSQSLNIKNPQFISAVNTVLNSVSKAGHVINIQSYYNSGNQQFVSRDDHNTYAVISIKPGFEDLAYSRVTKLTKSPDPQIEVRLGGFTAINEQINQQIKDDLKKAETLSLIFLIILLILVFGSIVPAITTFSLGGLGILGALFIMRALASFTTISSYSINVITLLGLGLAIDYSLFMVGRFREELSLGADVETAIKHSIKRSGKTIFFSGLTVIISFLSLLVFPQIFLRSMGMGGAAVVSITLLLALTILPAALAVLGPRINALRLPRRNLTKAKPAQTGFWYRFVTIVMKWPALTLVIALAILLPVAMQFYNVKLSKPDIYSLPSSLSSWQVNSILTNYFNGAGNEPIGIIISTPSSTLTASTMSYLDNYVDQLSNQKGINTVDSLDAHLPKDLSPSEQASLLNSPKYRKEVLPHYFQGSTLQLTVYQSYLPQTPAAQQLVNNIRAIPSTPGYDVNVGGVTAQLVDLIKSLKHGLPYAAAIIMTATFILIMLSMSSVVLPFKAIIMALLSLATSFGVMVWVFQDHHLASLLSLTALGSVDATSLVLIFALAFGLSMDYEFFLLSRIKEEYEKTNDSAHSVAHGVEKTAGIITSAALLLISVIGLFMTSKVYLIQQIGLGLSAAVAIDATLVRMVVVPATMKILGRANWWAPKPLARFASRFSFRD